MTRVTYRRRVQKGARPAKAAGQSGPERRGQSGPERRVQSARVCSQSARVCSQSARVCSLFLGVTLFVLVLAGLSAAPADAQGLVPECPENLLVNAGFENGFSGRERPAEVVADGWQPWYEKLPGVDGLNYPPDFTPRNRYHDGPHTVLQGLWSQEQATHGSTHTAGLWQRVPVPPGSIVSAFVSAYAWATDGGSERHSKPPGTYFVALGIDPRAGTDPNSDHIVWTEPITVTDVWVPLSLEMPIHSSNVTVFTKGQPLRILAHNVSRWDEACLRVLRPVDEPTATPTERRWPTRTPAPDDPTPTITPSATSDPATQVALDINLALDVQATWAAASGQDEEPDDEASLGWGDDEATPMPTEPSYLEDDGSGGVSRGRSLAQWSGLLFLALGAMVGGLAIALTVFGSKRGDGQGSGSDLAADTGPDRDPDPVTNPDLDPDSSPGPDPSDGTDTDQQEGDSP